MPELSIIVPIYNVEKYLEKCIISILNQTYTDFELILINDGSPDNCDKIMNSLSQKDTRIVNVFQDNQGVSAARNAGLRIAKGKYIGFVDPDDFIEENMFEVLIREIKNQNAQLVCCGWNNYYSNEKIIESKDFNIPLNINNVEMINHVFDIPRTVLGVVWNKVFVKEYIDFEFNNDYVIGEDTMFIIQYCMKILNVCIINDKLYNFRCRTDSATTSNPGKMVLGLEVWREIISIMSDFCTESKSLAEKVYLDACMLYYSSLKGDINQIEYYNIAKHQLNLYIKKHFFSVLFNPKIKFKLKLLYFKTGFRA